MADNKKYQKISREKNNPWCGQCFSHRSLTVHHKDENKKNSDLSNLQVLCRKCHNEEHGFIRGKMKKRKKIGRGWKDEKRFRL